MKACGNVEVESPSHSSWVTNQTANLTFLPPNLDIAHFFDSFWILGWISDQKGGVHQLRAAASPPGKPMEGALLGCSPAASEGHHGHPSRPGGVVAGTRRGHFGAEISDNPLPS